MKSDDSFQPDQPIPIPEPGQYPPADTAPPRSPFASIAELPTLQGRLHPLTIVFSIVQAVRRLILPAIPLVLLGNKTGLFTVISLFVLLALARAVVRYWTFNYRIEGNDIITKQGILERTERHIPLERVQEIRLEQGILHRLFGVADVLVETAGGKGPEASLSVLSLGEAERLRRAVFDRPRPVAGTHGTVKAAAPDVVVLRNLRLSDLVLAGLTSNHLVSALVLVGAVWAFLDEVLPENIYEQVAARAYESVNRVLREGPQTAVMVTIVALLTVFLVGTIFSVIGSIILFYGFTLSRRGEDLHRAYGMFTQRSSSLPRRRIQVLEIEEGWLRRLFGLATLRADTAGSRAEGNERRGGRDVILPIVHRDDLRPMLHQVFPDLDETSADWRQVSRRSIAGATIKGALLSVVVTIGLLVYRTELQSLWPLAAIPIVYLLSLVRYRTLGYALSDHYFHTRRGWLSRSTHIVPIRNAQVIVIRQTYLDRLLRLATLMVDTAGQAYTKGGPRISNLPQDEALALAKVVSVRAAALRYRW